MFPSTLSSFSTVFQCLVGACYMQPSGALARQGAFLAPQRANPSIRGTHILHCCHSAAARLCKPRTTGPVEPVHHVALMPARLCRAAVGCGAHAGPSGARPPVLAVTLVNQAPGLRDVASLLSCVQPTLDIGNLAPGAAQLQGRRTCLPGCRDEHAAVGCSPQAYFQAACQGMAHCKGRENCSTLSGLQVLGPAVCCPAKRARRQLQLLHASKGAVSGRLRSPLKS